MKVPSKPHQRALLLAKAYQMIDKCIEIFDVCGIHTFAHDIEFENLLKTLDKEFTDIPVLK